MELRLIPSRPPLLRAVDVGAAAAVVELALVLAALVQQLPVLRERLDVAQVVVAADAAVAADVAAAVVAVVKTAPAW